MADDMCQCPKCGRLHRDLGFGAPPASIAAPPIQTAEHPLAKEWRAEYAYAYALGNTWPALGNRMAAELDRLSTSRPAGLGGEDAAKFVRAGIDAMEEAVAQALDDSATAGLTLSQRMIIEDAACKLDASAIATRLHSPAPVGEPK